MLTIGFVLGHWCYQQHVLPRKLISARTIHMGTSITSQTQHPDAKLGESECIHPQEQGLNMTKNVAYVKVSTMT